MSSKKEKCEKLKTNEEASASGSKTTKDTEHTELQTIQSDPRYNQCQCSAWCFDNFVLHIKCNRLLGEKHESCALFAKYVQAVCPNEWVRKWETQVEDGTFPADLPPASGAEKKEDDDDQDL